MEFADPEKILEWVAKHVQTAIELKGLDGLKRYVVAKGHINKLVFRNTEIFSNSSHATGNYLLTIFRDCWNTNLSDVLFIICMQTISCGQIYYHIIKIKKLYKKWIYCRSWWCFCYKNIFIYALEAKRGWFLWVVITITIITTNKQIIR